MSTRRRTTTTTTRIEVSSDRGVFMISVAAELAKMHPQTLRMYEQRGLIEPKRSPKGTRLYSHEDVERLRGLGPKRFGKTGHGDIHYRFVLDLPERLTAEQETAVDEFAKAFNGNPRRGLFTA